MKVCLFHENHQLLGISGIGKAYLNIKKALEYNNVDFTTNPKEDYDILHLNFIGVQAVQLALKAKKEGKKIVIHTHMTQEDFRNSYFLSNMLAPNARMILKKFYGMADVLISPSHYTKYIMRSYGLTNRIEIISNGIDSREYNHSEEKRKRFRQEYGIKKTAIFSVGIPFKRKGIYDFVEIAKRMSEYDFYWVGKKLRMLNPDEINAMNKAPKNCQFTGYVNDVMAAYSAGDVFLFPSYEENQGIVILEAAAMGKPILIREIGAYQDWLKHGENCLMAKDNKEFINNIDLVLEDKEVRNKLIRNGHKLAKEHDLRKIGKKYKAVYESLM